MIWGGIRHAVSAYAAIKEMEAAAVAWVAWTMEKSFMALKAVSDFLDSPEKSETQFTKNLAKTTQNLSRGLVGVIENRLIPMFRRKV